MIIWKKSFFIEIIPRKQESDHKFFDFLFHQRHNFTLSIIHYKRIFAFVPLMMREEMQSKDKGMDMDMQKLPTNQTIKDNSKISDKNN